MKSVELVILNYNGRKHLELLLPTAVTESLCYGSECRVVVVDNRSTESDVEWIREAYPTVTVWIAPKNEYLFSYNEYALESEADILLLLNNDLILRPNFVGPLVKYFEMAEVFSVGATSLDWEGREFTCGPAHLIHENGSYRWPYDCSKQEACHTFFTSGGFMAVDRKKFLMLGGFDRLFFPAYCEDVDLCFRAWRMGWRCVFEPESVVLHREGGSWCRNGRKKVNRILLKNSLLFQWTRLPMDKHLLDRWFSRLKVIIGTLRQADFGWLSTMVGTWWIFQRLGRDGSLYKTSGEELILIEKSINMPLGNPDNQSIRKDV